MSRETQDAQVAKQAKMQIEYNAKKEAERASHSPPCHFVDGITTPDCPTCGSGPCKRNR